MENWSVIPIAVLADLGAGLLEVTGKLVLPAGGTAQAELESAALTIEVEEARVRTHLAGAGGLWEQVESLSLSAAALQAVVLESAPADPPADGSRDARIKVMTRGAEVTGFLRLPMKQSIDSHLQSAEGRFLALRDARVQLGGPGDLGIGGLKPLVLVPVRAIAAAVETRAMIPVGSVEEVLGR